MAIISLVAAMTENYCLGLNNKMPWHLPADLAHFKQLTLHKSIIMGRKTYESIGKALPNRHNIIITRQSDFNAPDCTIVSSLEQALQTYSAEEELMIIGGAQIYQQALPVADRLYLTLIHTMIEGDAYFPHWDAKQWQEVSREIHPADEHNAYAYDFLTLKRC